MAAASLLAAGQHAMHSAWHRYCDHLAQRPLATKVLTGAARPSDGAATRALRPPRRARARPRCPPAASGGPTPRAAAAPDAPPPPHHTPPPPTPLPQRPGIAGTLIGDGIAQGATHLAARRRAAAAPGPARLRRFQYDWARAARLCAYAALIGTPVGHYWFAFLDKVRQGRGMGGRQHAAGACGSAARSDLPPTPARSPAPASQPPGHLPAPHGPPHDGAHQDGPRPGAHGARGAGAGADGGAHEGSRERGAHAARQMRAWQQPPPPPPHGMGVHGA
jgi:hypothetical protein